MIMYILLIVAVLCLVDIVFFLKKIYNVLREMQDKKMNL